MKHVPATLLCDAYKICHRELYPKGTEVIYSSWTPRISRIKDIDHVVCFGVQGFIKKYLIDYFNEHFFSHTRDQVTEEYRRVIKSYLGVAEPDTSHIEALHKLGYLPIEIKAVHEGTEVPIRCPMLTIQNTLPEFFWLTNYLETLMSNELWMPMTSATIARKYRKILDKYNLETTGSTEFTKYQGHDFSLRGMSCLEAGMSSGAGHLLSFVGSDTIPATCYHEQYYNADVEKEFVSCSVKASEHSIASSYGHDNEKSYYENLIFFK